MTTVPTAARTRRICMLVYGDVPAGCPPMVNLGTSLSEAGYDVDLVCLAPPSTGAGTERPVFGIRVIPLRIRSRRLFHGLFGPAPALRAVAAVQYVLSYAEFVTKAIVAALRTHADLYEANDLPVVLPALISARLLGRPMVYRAHELWSEASPNVRFAAFWRFLERALVPRCDYLVTPEENRSRIYQVELGAQRPPMTIRNCPPYLADHEPPAAGRAVPAWDPVLDRRALPGSCRLGSLHRGNG